MFFAAQEIPFWAWVLILLALSVFGVWRLAIAAGVLSKPATRWGKFGHGPPMTRIGHAAWGVMAFSVAIALLLGERRTLVWQWFAAGFAALIITGIIDLVVARVRR